MSGQYRLDPNYEKVDEMELMSRSNMISKKQDMAMLKKTTEKTPIFSVAIQLLALTLLIIITGMIAYVIFRINDMADNCGSACSNSLSDSTAANSNKETLCNTTEVKEIINGQLTHLFKTNEYGTNFTAVLQLLQELRTDQLIWQENTTDVLSLIAQHSENFLFKLVDIISTLSIHKDASITTAAVVDDILVIVKELLQLQNASVLLNSVTPVSCKDIKTALPDSPSGYYHVNSRDIYCNMDDLCGSGGGWTRLAYLNMEDSTESCPEVLSLIQSGGVRACRRPNNNNPSCSPSITFPTNGISYSEICGRLNGYQFGSSDAVEINDEHDNLDSYYVDGVSLTRGSPRQHVWTFMAGLSENYFFGVNCPCNTPPGDSQVIQSFVGSNYFCESGNPNSVWAPTLYKDDLLWDGKGCGSQEKECCKADGIPWFHRQFNSTTTDYLELRICSDQQTSNEGTPVAYYEIFVTCPEISGHLKLINYVETRPLRSSPHHRKQIGS